MGGRDAPAARAVGAARRRVGASRARSWAAFESAAIWHAAIEHHFVLVAARNLVQALELDPPTSVVLDATMRAELVDGRNLLEHWAEGMPVFNMHPRRNVPRQAKRFAALNPKDGPYEWLAFGNTNGAEVIPHVSAFELHDLLERGRGRRSGEGCRARSVHRAASPVSVGGGGLRVVAEERRRLMP